MATSPPSIDPQTGERIQSSDWRDQWPSEIEKPITSVRPSQQVNIDPSTGERIGSSVDDSTASDMLKAGIYGKMLNVPAGYAYQNIDEIDKQLRETGGDDFDKGVGYAIKTGFEDTPLGLILRGKSPEPFESQSHLGNFIHDASAFLTDPLAILSGFTSEAGVGIAGFAVDAAMRKTLMDQYEKGDVRSFRELTDRAGAVLWEGAKGALLAKAGMAAGEIPVGSMIGRSALASTAMKGLYQSAVMTTAGSLLNGQIPSMGDFERTAALVMPLNLASGGRFLKTGEAEQALRDVYRQTGKTPEESEIKLRAQPVVSPDAPEGLRPAIKIGENITEANPGETHPELAERMLGQKPVDMDQLEADPSLADKVLQNPTQHLQQVIDRAWQLKKEAIESGASDDELPNRGSLKSGRGFVTPDGKFMERQQAKAWVKENEPSVAEMWEGITGDRNAEFHADDYGIARMRVSNRATASGEPDLDRTATPLQEFLGRSRSELNKIKASGEDTGRGFVQRWMDSRYGKSVVRTLWVGPRNTLRAVGRQTSESGRKLLPNIHDQEALSFLRDYRDSPEELRQAIEEVRNGSNEKLKLLIPSMEKALNPTPEMLKADQMLTSYFTRALEEGRQFGTLDSNIDPSRYSPRLFMEATAEGEEGRRATTSKFSTKTPHAIRREYLHLLDPLKSGDIEARTFNAFDELEVYADRHANSVATSLLKTELKNSEMGKLATRDNVPKDWVPLPGSQQTVVSAETGESFQRAFYTPKTVADAMSPLLEPSIIRNAALWKSYRMAQRFTKAIELGLSPFHMKAMALMAENNMKWSSSDFVKLAKSDMDSEEFKAQEREGALHGLETTMTSRPFEAYRALKPSSIPQRGDVLKNTFGIKQVRELGDAVTHATFDIAQRKFKVVDFSTKQARWIASHPEATDVEYGTAMRSIAKEVNAVYGGLNWDVMGVSGNWLEIVRGFLLAPDWTFSNLANLKYTTEGGPGGNAARMFWIRSFTTAAIMTQAMSLAVSGQQSDHWNEVYLGEDKNGKKMYSNMFFAGAPKDAITWITRMQKDGGLTGTIEFASYKAGPLLGIIPRLYSNKDWKGREISKKTDTAMEKTEKQIEFSAEQATPIPFSVRDVFESDEDLSYRDFLLSLVGSQVKHEGSGEKVKSPRGFQLPGARRGGVRLPGQRGRQ